jgi:hypothetical protein
VQEIILIVERFQALSQTQLIILVIFTVGVLAVLKFVFAKLGIKSGTHVGGGSSDGGGGCD